jgi:flagellar motor switch/type III secretory pathway protein FliN
MSATAVLNLSKAGFTDAQVQALAQYFDEQVATKADIEQLRLEIEKVRSDLTLEIGQVRLEIEKVRSDLEQKIAAVDLRLSETKADIVKWVAGLLVAQGAAVVALIRFLPGMHP